jgi:hypothetical protein
VARPKGIWTEKRLIVVCLYRTSPEIGQSYAENAHLNVIKVAGVSASFVTRSKAQGKFGFISYWLEYRSERA